MNKSNINPRADQRQNDEMRPVRIIRNYLKHPEGSVLISIGDTEVICTASIEEKQPHFMRAQKIYGTGWVTAEYAMLPRSTSERLQRDRGKIGGRTQEIQRLIGRSLRSVVDRRKLGERTIWIDCDVIQADGGTRTAAITGAFIALWDACQFLKNSRQVKTVPINDRIAAVSVGIVRGVPMLDLCYEEDSKADVDMNIVMTGKSEFVELQGTAEERPFSKEKLDRLVALGTSGIAKLIELQNQMIEGELEEVSSEN